MDAFGSALFSFRHNGQRWIVQTRRIAPGRHVGIFRNPPFLIVDLVRLRVEVARV